MESLRGSALAVLILLAAARAGASTTRVTDYTYNADGALTSITKSVVDGESSQTYVVWDDFVPDEGTPSDGEVRIGNGTLAGIGPATAASEWTGRFRFDARDRLTEYSDRSIDEFYDYHAGGSMASSANAGDELSFYYDASANEQACNLHQARSGRWSGYLGELRYLDDGTEQALLPPRKDVVGVYEPAAESLERYIYGDAYGAQLGAASDSFYDLRDNPFRYAGEYRDPLWGGYYLRTRWYHPDLPSFLSRDSEPTLNRYGYAGGNPTMRTDPSGLSYMSEFGRPLGHFLHDLNQGPGGDVARIFLGPFLGPLQILADPPGFWDTIVHNRAQTDVFLALSVAAEVGSFFGDRIAVGAAVSLGKRFLARTIVDVAIGVGQSIASGAARGFKHFDYNALRQGLEYTASAVLFRSYTGFNVRTNLRLKAEDVGELVRTLENAPPDTALVFRARLRLAANIRLARFFPAAKPLQEAANLGFYHERLIAITRDDVLQSEAIGEGVNLSRGRNPGYQQLTQILKSAGKHTRFQFVGQVASFDSGDFFVNPRSRPILSQSGLRADEVLAQPNSAERYRRYRNNCHHHATAVLKNLGF